MVYSLDWSWNSKYLFEHTAGGIEVLAAPENILTALNGIYDLLYTKLIKFLDSKQSKKWFDNQTSRFIFPSTVSYQEDYAEGKGVTLLNNREISDIEEIKKVLQKVTLQMLKEYIENNILDKKFRFWFDSSIEIEKVKKEFHKSMFYKRFKN